MVRLKVILAAVLCLGGTFSLYPQIKIVPREKLESVASPMLSADSASFKFDVKHIKADRMYENDAPVTFVFGFENVGRKSLKISRLVTTCSCVTATSTLQEIAPGQKAEIRARYNPKGHSGRFERRIFVYTGAADSPSAVLRLSVDVSSGQAYAKEYPVQVGSIRTTTTEVRMKKGQKTVSRLKFVNVSDSPLRIGCEKIFLPSCLDWKTEPSIVDAGKEGEMVLTYDPSAGDFEGTARLMLKNLGVPPSQSTLTVVVY